jgi:hypothetical protein
MQAHSSPAAGSVSFPPDRDLRLFDHLLSGTPGLADRARRSLSLRLVSSDD